MGKLQRKHERKTKLTIDKKDKTVETDCKIIDVNNRKQNMTN